MPWEALQTLDDANFQLVFEAFQQGIRNPSEPTMELWSTELYFMLAKAGKPACLASSWRPIALLSVVRKAYEMYLWLEMDLYMALMPSFLLGVRAQRQPMDAPEHLRPLLQ